MDGHPISFLQIVFDYIEEKDAFQFFFTKKLARRLISESSASEDVEGLMISKLKVSGQTSCFFSSDYRMICLFRRTNVDITTQ